MITADADLLRWIGSMLKRIYTKLMLPAVHPEGAYLPLNPFTFLQKQLQVIRNALMDSISPYVDEFGRIFSSSFESFIIDIRCFNTADVSVEPPPSDEQNLLRSSSVAEHINYLLVNEQAHVDTVMLRRSARSNKCDGFKVPPMSDKKLVMSKVKPRKVPDVQCSSSATLPCASDKKVKVNSVIPPPTPISTIQSIGTNMCGLHPNQLSKQKLLSPSVAQERDVHNTDA